MVSRTKFEIDNKTIASLFQAAGLDGAADITPLGAGEYNAVFSVKAGGEEYAIKIAPQETVPILTYEIDMMASEMFWYQQIKEHTQIAVPKIFASDLEKKQIPAEYFIMEKLPGQPLNTMKLTPDEKQDSNTQLAQMAAQIHKIKNDKFGYIQNALYDDWYQAIRAMTQACIDDCARKGKQSPNGLKLLAYIDRHQAVLQQAESCMVNFDLHSGNIVAKRANGVLQYAWIDPERSFWGDRICDFVCLEMMKPFAEKKDSLAAYNAAAEQPVLATKEESIRYAAAQAYIGLIMETEKYFRYSRRHFGWWRNVGACMWLFPSAFKVLESA